MTSDAVVGTEDELVRSGVRRAGKRLVPLLILLYFVNYLDRVNIGFAGPNGMNEELGLSATLFGIAAGVFFIGYLLLEVPSNRKYSVIPLLLACDEASHGPRHAVLAGPGPGPVVVILCSGHGWQRSRWWGRRRVLACRGSSAGGG